jgi:nucleotide-binding universal stress UspA family protein
MNRYAAILLPLDGSAQAAKAAGCALWLAQSLGATLHAVNATAQAVPAVDALARLRVPQAQQSHVVVHQRPGAAEAAVLEEIAEHRIDLVVVSALDASASSAAVSTLSSVAQAVIERCPVPVVLLPPRYRESLPWTAMIAGATGEASSDRAMAAATQLAAALRLSVTVVHCEDSPGKAAASPLGAYADAPHHEYARRLEHLVQQGTAHGNGEQAHRVRAVALRHGEPASLLLEQAARLGSAVVALGWHGELGHGRATVFKRLLEEAECPLLVVKGSERSTARLKVGQEIDED